MTSQAKEAIRQMKAAGFARSEFWVETERIYRAQYRKEGCKHPYDYGKANIYVRNSALIEPRLQAILAADLGVLKTILKSGTVLYCILTDYSKRGKMEVVDYNVVFADCD